MLFRNPWEQEKRGPVVAAVAAAAASYASGATLSVALLAGARSLVLSGISALLAPKQKNPNTSSYSAVREGLTQQVRQPITERRAVYGETKVSGPILFIVSTNNEEFLHIIIGLASHEIEEIGECFVNDVSVPPDILDGSGKVTSGQYANHLWIKKYLGTDTQTADVDLIAATTKWTTNHRLQGIAYAYVKLKWSSTIYPSGIPNFSFYVRGKKCLDTRDSTTKYTPNVALMTRDYLCDTALGLQTASGDIDTTALDAAANTCEEIVDVTTINDTIVSANSSLDTLTLTGLNSRLQFQTGDKVLVSGGALPGGLTNNEYYYVIAYQRKDTPRIKLALTLADSFSGTAVNITSSGTGSVSKVGEPRYIGGGALQTSTSRGQNLEELLSGMSGAAIYAGGKWRILAGEYQTPTVYFDEDDLVDSIKVQTKVSRADRFNIVKGVYTSPLNDGNPSDYPPIENSTYKTNDGGEELFKNIDLPFTQRPHTAMRIAKINLERSRQEIVFNATFNLNAFRVQVGDNFYFSFDRYGWSNKIFEVIEWSLDVKDGAPVINITARENASNVYDWSSGEETSVDPAPNTTLPNPFLVSVIAGFSIDSFLISTQSGDKTYKVIATWDAPTDQFVLSGGRYEVQFKETTQTEYTSAGFIGGDIFSFEIAMLKPDVLYDIRIFAYNSLGVRSNEAVINNYLVGTTVTTNTEDWENETLARDGDDWEADTLTSEDWET